MKTLMYINEAFTLNSKDFIQVGDYEKAIVTEPYLIVGIFQDGLYQNPENSENLQNYNLTWIEKYLMASSNVDFKIKPTEFRTPNLPFWVNEPDFIEFPTGTAAPYFETGEADSVVVSVELYEYLTLNGYSFDYYFSIDNGVSFFQRVPNNLFINGGGGEHIINLGAFRAENGMQNLTHFYIKNLTLDFTSEIYATATNP
jgi:hypothetical protein